MARVSALPIGLALALLCACRITFVPVDDANSNAGGSGARTPLNAARARITLSQDADSNQAVLTIVLRDDRNRAVLLGQDQAIEVNGLPVESVGSGRYERTLDASGAYEFTVREPTRGVERTTLNGPSAFEITQPIGGGPASLSGFTLSWSATDASLAIRVLLSQAVFDGTRTQTLRADSDAGSLSLSLSDLSQFVQGADLRVRLTKIATGGSVAGFASSMVELERSDEIAVSPAP